MIWWYFLVKFNPYILQDLFMMHKCFLCPRKYKIKLFEINFLIRVNFFAKFTYSIIEWLFMTNKKMLFNSTHKITKKKLVLPSSILIIMLLVVSIKFFLLENHRIQLWWSRNALKLIYIFVRFWCHHYINHKSLHSLFMFCEFVYLFKGSLNYIYIQYTDL